MKNKYLSTNMIFLLKKKLKKLITFCACQNEKEFIGIVYDT